MDPFDPPVAPVRLTHHLCQVPELHIAVTGEVDHSNAQVLARHLRELLEAHPAVPVVLDLSELGFCDCAGLSALLETRSNTMTRCPPLRIAAVSPLVMHLLEATDTTELPGAPAARRADPGPSTDPRTDDLGAGADLRCTPRGQP